MLVLRSFNKWSINYLTIKKSYRMVCILRIRSGTCGGTWIVLAEKQRGGKKSQPHQRLRYRERYIFRCIVFHCRFTKYFFDFFLQMGIKGLTKFLALNAPKAMQAKKFESYAGHKIAIDASMSIYQFLIVIGRNGTGMLTNEAGEVTSHLQGMLTRTTRLLDAGLKPVYVFDGQPPNLKKQELANRYTKRADATEDLEKALETGNKEEIEKFSKRTVKATKQHSEDCKELLRLMGVPVIEAPSEAEAQCAALCKSGKVDAVSSEDMDCLTFGAPRFLRHLMDPISKKVPVMEYEVSKVLEELNLSMDQFIDLCILSGCDYCESIRGIGTQTALKLIRQHGSMEKILENINKERYPIPDDWPFQEVRDLFREPLVFTDDEQPEIKWSAPDEEGLMKFLVDENGFNSNRDIIIDFLKPVSTFN